VTVKIIVATRSTEKSRVWCSAFEPVWPEAHFIAWADEQGAVDADYAIVWGPPAELFQRELQLKAVFNLGSGVDALMKLPALPDNLPIVRLEDGGMVEQMVEYIVHGLVRASREFTAYEASQRAGHWNPLPPIRRDEWPVGVMGMGTIGAVVAQRIASLGYSVAGWSRSPHSIPGVRNYSGPGQFSAFLARTRALVNLLPLTPATENILNRDTLGQLHPDAYLINVARGRHLVEADLLDLLDSGRLKGALLDVFRTEPLPAGHPFWQHPKITVTPHISAITLARNTAEQIVNKIHLMRRGQPVTGLIDRAAGY
jgi:glyoxylate/hydroxypyruvate reductase A